MKKVFVGVLVAMQLAVFCSMAEAELVETGERYLGTPYQFGGNTPDQGFDPSGFVQYVTKETWDAPLPRTVREQWKQGESVERAELERGDLIFFGASTTPTHVAIYAGNDTILHVTQSKGVITTELSTSAYWNPRYLGAKRITEEPALSLDPFVQEAAKYIGIPYIFGEADPEIGFDCSGLTNYVFRQMGIFLPRSAEEQWLVGEEIELEDIQPGDVVFFKDTYKPGISHNGIYAGNNQFIHASRSESVTIGHLTSTYWQEQFAGVRRFNDLTLEAEVPVVSVATKYVGEVPYKQGGVTPEGFDTAGFIQYAFRESYGIELPRYASGQLEHGDEIAREDVRPGDIVFFEGNTLNPAIYISEDRVVHVTLSQGVTVTNFAASNYWRDRYVTAVRVPEATKIHDDLLQKR
ncbi:C40 family peptidase [Shouchella patagoniensis]|uniref:C40 family peptidase n=1 Tax=Shouchella patagoniensis TaxID=228576 RepID=UPI000994EB55|nr:NlpC/P60 family protein [Shouchella patagoniensis]